MPVARPILVWMCFAKLRGHGEAFLSFALSIPFSAMVVLPQLGKIDAFSVKGNRITLPFVSTNGSHTEDSMLKASIVDCIGMYAYGFVLRMLLPTDVFSDLRFMLHIRLTSGMTWTIVRK